MKKNSTQETTKKKMPTWIKRSLLIVGLFILMGGSYATYLFKFKEYDVADSEVKEITKETYNVDLPDGSKIELDEEGNIVETDSSGQVTSSSTTASANNENANENVELTAAEETSDENVASAENATVSTSNSKTEKSSSKVVQPTGKVSSFGTSKHTSSKPVTVATIKEKYKPVMTKLQADADVRIDALVNRAANEYQTKQANGESINYAYFYKKYTSAASVLEGRTDKVFYQVIYVIEKDLVKNGFSKTHAKSFVSEYKAIKETQRKEFLKKAMNY
ncbi:hypothetical protein [Paenisporosarcina sp. NPDC076898]|uniref:hypothetical protein n=1 Tax=unclassified Paenisporosarcina TaxID=2642018 RepID=UPI003CFBD158